MDPHTSETQVGSGAVTSRSLPCLVFIFHSSSCNALFTARFDHLKLQIWLRFVCLIHIVYILKNASVSIVVADCHSKIPKSYVESSSGSVHIVAKNRQEIPVADVKRRRL